MRLPLFPAFITTCALALTSFAADLDEDGIDDALEQTLIDRGSLGSERF